MSGPKIAITTAFAYDHGFGALEPFFHGLSEGRLLATRCARCGAMYCPPRIVCAHDGGSCDWTVTTAEGVVDDWTEADRGSSILQVPGPVTFGLVGIDGCVNRLFARLHGPWHGLPLPARVRLCPRQHAVPHPIQLAVFERI